MNIQCPNCLGNKEVFDGEDYSSCNYCEGLGEVSELKFNNFDPLDNLKFEDEKEIEDEYQDT